jgi:hypothetical protein
MSYQSAKELIPPIIDGMIESYTPDIFDYRDLVDLTKGLCLRDTAQKLEQKLEKTIIAKLMTMSDDQIRTNEDDVSELVDLLAEYHGTTLASGTTDDDHLYFTNFVSWLHKMIDRTDIALDRTSLEILEHPDPTS